MKLDTKQIAISRLTSKIIKKIITKAKPNVEN